MFVKRKTKNRNIKHAIGLAVWQLARGFGGSNHNSHIYHHYDNNQPQQTYAAGAQPAQTYAGSVQTQAVAPSAPDQSTGTVVQTTAGQIPSNQSNQPSNPEAVTAIPEFDAQYQFSTIHPSLFPYGKQSESLEYWAKSHSKTLRTSSPDTNDSIITSTTSTTASAVSETPESTTISLPTTTISA